METPETEYVLDDPENRLLNQLTEIRALLSPAEPQAKVLSVAETMRLTGHKSRSAFQRWTSANRVKLCRVGGSVGVFADWRELGGLRRGLFFRKRRIKGSRIKSKMTRIWLADRNRPDRISSSLRLRLRIHRRN